MLDLLAFFGLSLAVLPALLVGVNLALYRTPAPPAEEKRRRVSILIPARNEERHIEQAVRAALASESVDVEVVVMDDHSTDRTAAIVEELAAQDSRVRIEEAPELPPGWSGKQHACHVLAGKATTSRLLFLDADVQLAKDGVARALAFLERSNADLVSGFPRQITGTLVEKLVIPLIHFVLLGYLPLLGMRLSQSESFAAGCGQLFLARREAYERAGGHAAIRATFHDGLQLPRAFRRAGLKTDLFDATSGAACRMYQSARQVFLGLAKNAHEGMAGRVAIWIWSILLLGGHVLPFVLVLVGFPWALQSEWWRLAALATALGVGTRWVLALRFRQSFIGAVLHPMGVLLLVAIQWYSFFVRRRGGAIAWKDRAQK